MHTNAHSICKPSGAWTIGALAPLWIWTSRKKAIQNFSAPPESKRGPLTFFRPYPPPLFGEPPGATVQTHGRKQKQFLLKDRFCVLEQGTTFRHGFSVDGLCFSDTLRSQRSTWLFCSFRHVSPRFYANPIQRGNQRRQSYEHKFWRRGIVEAGEIDRGQISTPELSA